MKCSSCGAESSGRYCSSCGTSLGAAHCANCNANLSPGARFCTQCGRAAGTSGGRTSQLPWLIAGAAILVAIVVILLPAIRGTGPDGGSATPAAPFATGGSGTGQPPALTGTPREQADRLFNRIMQERSNGNVEQAKFFVPMAVQAYQAAAPLDADGLYHLSLIQAVGDDFAASRVTALRILQATPTHLLGLAALAEAAIGLGDSAAARDAWTRYLDNLQSERAKQLGEYVDHARILDQYEQAARSFVGR